MSERTIVGVSGDEDFSSKELLLELLLECGKPLQTAVFTEVTVLICWVSNEVSSSGGLDNECLFSKDWILCFTLHLSKPSGDGIVSKVCSAFALIVSQSTSGSLDVGLISVLVCVV